MKQFVLFLVPFFLLSCNASSDSQTASRSGAERELESPDILVTLSGAPTGTAYLIGFFGDQRFRADSAQVNAGGQIRFQRAEPYDPGLYYLLLRGTGGLQILIDADQTFELKTSVQDMVGQMQVKGSQDNELLYENLKFEEAFNPRFRQVAQELKGLSPGDPRYEGLKNQQEQLLAERSAHLEKLFQAHPNTLFTQFKKAGQNPELREVRGPDGQLDTKAQLALFRQEFWQDVDFDDERLLHTPVIANKLERYITELTPQHPDSIYRSASGLIDQVLDKPEYFKFFANWIVLHYEPAKTSLMDPEAVYVRMIQEYFTPERAFWSDASQVQALQMRADEMAASLVGKKGPDVVSTNPDGEARSIYEIDAPYVVVFMYNPECEHCIEQTPKLKRFYQEWKSKGVEVFAIAIDTDESKWKTFIRQNQLNWINVFDPTNRSIYKKYFVDVTPEIYVLNPDRTIIAKNLKVFQIEEVIRRDQAKRG